MSDVLLLYSGCETFKEEPLIDAFDNLDTVNKYVARYYGWIGKVFTSEDARVEWYSKTIKPQLQYLFIKKLKIRTSNERRNEIHRTRNME